MKTSALSLLALALPAAASPLQTPNFASVLRSQFGVNNGEATSLGTRVVNGVTVQRTKIRYGPYHIPGAEVLEPSSMQTMWQGRGKGSLTNVPSMDVQKPCTGCMITYFRASIEDQGGKDLNVNDGLMLHHMVLFNGGEGHFDSTCGNRPVSLPHLSIQASQRNTEHIFSSGNERSVADFLATGNKAGYKVNDGDKFYLLNDMMNMNQEAKDVYLVMYYDHLPTADAKAQGFKSLKAIWLDANDCNTSDVAAPRGKKVFDISSKPWTTDIAGPVILSIGHVHDGGVKITVEVNDKVVCTNTQKYGTNPDYTEMSALMKVPSAMSGMSKRDKAMPGFQHISQSTECVNAFSLNNGDKMVTKGYYDITEHPWMVADDGKPKPLMAIAIVYTMHSMDYAQA